MKKLMNLPNSCMLSEVPGHELTERLYQLRVKEREQLVEFLVYLGELDRRKLYLDLAFPSCFQFCVEHLGLSRSSTFRRVVAARLVARFPVVREYLADARLSLTTLVELRDVLDEDRLDEILARAAGRNEDQVKELVAALRPRPAPIDLFRRLPATAVAEAPGVQPVDSAGPAPATELNMAGSGAAPPASCERSPDRGQIQPISEELRVLRVTVGREFAADLERARAALSHQIPDGRLEAVLHHCLRVTLELCEKRRRGTGRASPGKASASRTRYVPAAVRDEIWRRDGGSCAFVSADGRRCGSTSLLELHHIMPFAVGGPATAGNLEIRCAGHNRHQVRKELGEEEVRRKIARGRQARGGGGGGADGG
jgi:hypothetical protein